MQGKPLKQKTKRTKAKNGKPKTEIVTEQRGKRSKNTKRNQKHGPPTPKNPAPQKHSRNNERQGEQKNKSTPDKVVE